jgi:tellurite resistance protein TerC
MLLSLNEYVNELGRLVGLDINMPHIEVSTPLSLGIIFGVLLLSMLVSVVIRPKRST